MNIHLYTWLITIGVMAAVLLFDVFVIGRKPHEPSMKECGIFVGAFSKFFELMLPGIVVNAVLATFVTAAATLAAWSRSRTGAEETS